MRLESLEKMNPYPPEEEKPLLSEIKITIPLKLCVTYPRDSAVDRKGSIILMSETDNLYATFHARTIEDTIRGAMVYEFDSKFYLSRTAFEKAVTAHMTSIAMRKIRN